MRANLSGSSGEAGLSTAACCVKTKNTPDTGKGNGDGADSQYRPRNTRAVHQELQRPLCPLAGDRIPVNPPKGTNASSLSPPKRAACPSAKILPCSVSSRKLQAEDGASTPALQGPCHLAPSPLMTGTATLPGTHTYTEPDHKHHTCGPDGKKSLQLHKFTGNFIW